MKKEKFSLNINTILLFFVLAFLSHELTYSQCVNPTPIGNTSQIFCDSNEPKIENFIVSGGEIAWFDAPSGGTQYDKLLRLENNKTYYADDITGGSCSPNRLAVTVTINGTPPTNTYSIIGVCADENATIADLPATGTNIEWYDAKTGGNLLSDSTPLVNGVTYYVQQTANGCTSKRLGTAVILIAPETPTVAPTQTFCATSNPTVDNLKAIENNVIWYESEMASLPLDISTALINGEDYWATQESVGCESLERAKTTVFIDTPPNAGISSSLNECEIDLVTTNLFDKLGGSPDITGVWTGPSSLSGGYLGTFEPGVNSSGTYTYTVKSSLGACPDASANVAVVIEVVTPPTGPTTQTFCEIENPTVDSLSPSGNNINWYDSDNATIPLTKTAALVDGKVYYATITNTSGCESVLRLEVTANIEKPLPPTGAATQTFCEINNPTIENLSPSGNEINWYDSDNATTPLTKTAALVDGKVYYATITNTAGCESVLRLEVTANIEKPLPPTGAATQTFCEIDNP
ncbi:hypothetical protein EC396_02270, partial [Lutibacter sp. HS1-25]